MPRAAAVLAAAAVLFAAACVSAPVLSWGPVSHQAFGRLLVQQRAQGLHLDSFVLGNSAPDAIKHLNMRLHTFEFATYQMRAALNASSSSAFDPVSFSLGYGCHLAEDVVGHHAHGYLNPQHDHESEAAVDTYYHHVIPDITHSPFPWLSFSAEGLQFVSQATRLFAEQLKTPGFFFNESQLSGSNDSYQREVDLELAAILINFLYKTESSVHLQDWDTCPTSSFENTEKHLLLSQKWSLDTCQAWMDLVADDPYAQSPDTMDNTMRGKVNALYQANQGTSCA